MAPRTFAIVLAFALVTVAAADDKGKAAKAPIVPMDIIHGTTDMLHDVYEHAFNFVHGLSTKHGIHTTAHAHFTKHLTNDPIAHVCSKVGCKAKDIQDTLSKTHGAVMQAKAQVYEHSAKVTGPLDDFAAVAVGHFEKHVPSYTGVVPKTFGNVALATLYAFFVAYVVFRLARFGLSTSLKLFCFFFCCGCCRGSKTAKKTGKPNSGKKTPDAKASPTKTTAKAGKK